MLSATPLLHVEREVQRHAKDISLDLSAEDADAALRGLIDDEIGAWSIDYKRGLRRLDIASPELLAERALRNLAGYGPIGPLLDDDDVWEIMIYAPDAAFT